MKQAEKGRFYNHKGEVVECGTREARENLYFPSVTAITGSYRDYGLELYHNEQMILAGATTPMLDGEDDKAFSTRVIETANEHRREAMERGTVMHGGAERFIETGVPDDKAPRELMDWIEQHLLIGPGESQRSTELAIINHAVGYAGTTDYWGLYRDDEGECIAVVDFKTQGVQCTERVERRKLKSGEVREYQRTVKSVKWVVNYAWQLAAYGAAAALRSDDMKIPPPEKFVSVVINTNTEHVDYKSWDYPMVKDRVWAPEKIERGARIMETLTRGWYLINDWPLIGSAERAAAYEKIRAAA